MIIDAHTRVWPDAIADRAIIERHGPGRVLSGSDWPMGNPATDIAALEALVLPAPDGDAIFGGNARRLLRIDEV